MREVSLNWWLVQLKSHYRIIIEIKRGPRNFNCLGARLIRHQLLGSSNVQTVILNYVGPALGFCSTVNALSMQECWSFWMLMVWVTLATGARATIHGHDTPYSGRQMWPEGAFYSREDQLVFWQGDEDQACRSSLQGVGG